MNRLFSCECCGGGNLNHLRKEIYEHNGGGYHLAISFNGSKRFFKCSECGNIWWTEPTSEFMHFVYENAVAGKIIAINNEKSLNRALKTG
jgi:hypothetical protein